MKKHLLPISIAAIFAATAACTAPGQADSSLTLMFDRPAEYFEEAFVIGNGTQGAIIYGGTTVDRLSLNDIRLWTGEPDTAVYSPGAYKALPEIRAALDREDYVEADKLQHKIQGHNSQFYQPLGTLTIAYADTAALITDYSRSLDLTTAVATTEYRRDGALTRTDYFASAPDSIIVVRITSEKPFSATVRFDSQLNHSVVASADALTATGRASFDGPEGAMRYADDRGIQFAMSAVATTDHAGSATPAAGSIEIADAREATVIIAMGTNFTGATTFPSRSAGEVADACTATARTALATGYDRLLRHHTEDYARLFGRVSLDLGTTAPETAGLPTDKRLLSYTDKKTDDPDLEELYFQYGRYLLISCSRTPCVPANLQGLWNEYLTAPWRSNYTVNINLEENYWPAEVTNLSELHMPLLTFIRQMPATGAATAREYYGVDRGWCLGHNTDIWAMTCPVGCHNDDPMWANWNMGGAWLSTHIWEHYLFTLDREFLKEYYPTLRGAAEFCLGWMIERDGCLITSPSTSPENKFMTASGQTAATCYGGAADRAMIRDCLTAAREAATLLDTDSTFVAEADNALRRLAPYKIGRAGNLQEWFHDVADEDPQHRHQSHLFGLYPGHHITVSSTPDLAAAAARTLEIKGDNTTGWSTGWRVNLYARLRDGKSAYRIYRRLLQYVSPDRYEGPDARRGGGTYPNLLDAHAPFQIDGNFGGTAGVAEMLIQSTADTITLLPALPDEWSDGRFKGLRARGAYTVDAEWAGGRAVRATVTSDAGGHTTVIANGESRDVTLAPGESVSLTFSGRQDRK